jgi:hypothetical protein
MEPFRLNQCPTLDKLCCFCVKAFLPPNPLSRLSLPVPIKGKDELQIPAIAPKNQHQLQPQVFRQNDEKKVKVGKLESFPTEPKEAV